MLKVGSRLLSIWCVINFILAFIILIYVIIFKKNSPILQVASFSEIEITSLSAKTIAALNALTILYNSCSVVVSVMVWLLIRKKPDCRSKMGFLGVAVLDRFCGSDGIFRLFIHRERTLAGECCSNCSIPYRN